MPNINLKSNYKFKTKAICLNPNDNIIISLGNLPAGHYLSEFKITIDAPILSGQKIALKFIKKDEPILKYGTTIGFANENIFKGQVLTNENILFKEFNRKHDYCINYKKTKLVSKKLKDFFGDLRDQTEVGTRNFIAVVSTVNCSATVVHEIASYFTQEKLKRFKNIDGVVAFSHSTGCGMELSGEPMDLLHRTLGGYINHPNVASSLVVGLGCERCQVGGLYQSQKLMDNPASNSYYARKWRHFLNNKIWYKCIEEMLEKSKITKDLLNLFHL